MEIKIKKDEFKNFLGDIKDKFMGTFVNKKLSYDDNAWQYNISDEFEKRFVEYSKEDIQNKHFIKVGAFIKDDNIFINLFRRKRVRKENTILKKNLTQMTAFEQIKLLKKIQTIANFRKFHINSHAYNRMKQRDITYSNVIDTLKYGIIVEYIMILNGDKIVDRRIKLRRLNSDKKQTNVIISLITKDIITVYKRNSLKDVNKNLNPDIYKADLNILL